MSRPFFLTTAIDYTNGAPHIGHAYEKVLADVLARYHRLKGEDVFFLTGVDQHGQKVQQSAEKQGLAPQEYVDGITGKFRALWEKLDVRYDGWAATTAPSHQLCVQQILQRLWDEKDEFGERRWIYKKSQGGYYSVRQEQFLTDKERGEDGEFGPEWGQVEFREEENYYFRLEPHRQWLLDFIDARSAEGRPFVVPDFRVAELRNAVEKLAGDLCISRPKARLSWGIEFPFDPDFVTYVWFDALVNYLSFAGYHPEGFTAKTRSHEDGEKAPLPDGSPRSSLVMPVEPTASAPAPSRQVAAGHWSFPDLQPALHVIGKDILIPAHGVYWPIMLKALGFTDAQMPTLLVHGWWNISGEKMSKSLGNIIDPDLLAEKYGAEAVRYYLMSDIATGRDADFSEERLAQRYNSDLANSLGNLLNRSLNMAWKYREGRVTNMTAEGLISFSLAEEFSSRFLTYSIEMEKNQIANACSEVNDFATITNVTIETVAPWKLAKEEKVGVEEAGERLDDVLYALAESLRIIAILISPVMPKAAAGIFAQLNWTGPMTLAEATWGKLPDGHQLGQPTPLFPRIEVPKE